MAAPKKRRIPISIDMTPMVDIAFLLLIFFMSTTQFKKPTEVEVSVPLSHSVRKLPETGMIVITITRNDDLYMSTEVATLDYANGLSERVETGAIHGKKWKADEIPPKIKELQVKRLVNIVVIRADRETSYKTIESVMETLQKNNLNILQLVTDLEEDRTVSQAGAFSTGE
ncbi:biopolymer transporter ExbD [candidate division KSB1 bacterium]|nr:MAG: biopolymer transporter ExbD [candidate division KSB1 bacterium]